MTDYNSLVRPTIYIPTLKRVNIFDFVSIPKPNTGAGSESLFGHSGEVIKRINVNIFE